MTAVVGFLRTEGDAYDQVMARAGGWRPSGRWRRCRPIRTRRDRLAAARTLRTRAALCASPREIVRDICSSDAGRSTRVRKAIGASRSARRRCSAPSARQQPTPLCGFYVAVAVETLRQLRRAGAAAESSSAARSTGGNVRHARSTSSDRRDDAGPGHRRMMLVCSRHAASRDWPLGDAASGRRAGVAAAQRQSRQGRACSSCRLRPRSTRRRPAAPAAALWLGEAAAVLLAEGLGDAASAAFARDERLAAFDRLQLPMSSALTRATMIRVGELIGASEIVFGEVTLGDRLRCARASSDLAPGREAAGRQRRGAADRHLRAVRSRWPSRLATATGRPCAPAARSPTPLPLEAFESYVKGLVAATPRCAAAVSRERDDAGAARSAHPASRCGTCTPRRGCTTRRWPSRTPCAPTRRWRATRAIRRRAVAHRAASGSTARSRN